MGSGYQTDKNQRSVVSVRSSVPFLPEKTQMPKSPGPIQFDSPRDASVDQTEASKALLPGRQVLTIPSVRLSTAPATWRRRRRS